MAGSIIDQLIVALRLDPQHQFKSDSDTALATSKKTREQLGRDVKSNTEGQKQFKEAIGDVTKAAIGLGAVLVGFKGVTSFIADQISASAAVGRLANNLDMSVQTLSAWEGVVKQMGGTSADADTSLQSLVTTLQEFNLTGTSAKIPFLNRLGISRDDLKNPTESLLKAADQFHGMDPAQAQTLGAGLGLTPAMVNLLEKGRVAVLALLDAQQKAGVVNDEDTKQAQAAQAQIQLLGAAYTRLGNDILTATLPGLIGFGNWLAKDAQSPEMKQVIKDTNDLATSFHRLGDALNLKISFDPFKFLLQWLDATLKEVGHLANAMTAAAHGNWGQAGAEAWGAVKDSPLGALVQGAGSLVQGKLNSQSDGAGTSPPSGGGMATVPMLGGGSLADRNHNPGNLMSGSGYRSFSSASAGWSAMAKQLLIDFYRHGQTTIASLIDGPHGWAPGNAPGNSPQSTAAYERYVAGRLGTSTGSQLNLADPNVLRRLMQSMYEFESGHRAQAGRGGSPITITGPITVTTNATDAKGVAAGLHSALRRQAYVASAQSGPV